MVLLQHVVVSAVNCEVFMYATIKAIAAFNVVGLPSKRVCARKLINNNNTVKKP